jgi:hypothetical protein
VEIFVMPRRLMDRCRFPLLLLVLFVAWPATRALADARPQVVAALKDMNDWLGPGANGRKWRKFLEYDRLRAQLAAADQADPVALAEIFDRYASVAGRPRTAPIERVRLALGDWIVEQADIPPADLPALVRAAKDDITPPSPETTGRFRRRLRTAFSRLNERLGRDGDNGKLWRQHLLSEELETQLAAETPDAAKLAEIHERFIGKHPGLESGQFVEVRSALGDFASQVALLQAGEEATGTFQGILDDLAARLETIAEQPSPADLEYLGAAVTELERYGQAPRVVWAMRSRFAQPNLQLVASQPFLERALSRNVDDVAPVRDMILGTDIYGEGRTVGRTEITSIPSPHEGSLKVLLNGTTYSDTVGYNGPVQIYSKGTTKIHGEKPIYLRSDGLYTGPSSAEATTSTRIRGITTRRHGPIGKFILKAANKRAYQSKAQAERIAAQHAEERIRERLDGETSERLANANQNYRGKFIAPLLRYDVYPERLHFATTKAGLHVTGLVRASDRLAADRPAPEAPAGSDLVLSLHESVINNLTRSILLGETLTQERAIEIYRNLQTPEDRAKPLPPEVAIDPETGPWSVTLAADEHAEPQEGDDLPRELGPVTVRIDDGRIRVTVHGIRYEVNGNVHDAAMDITVVYRLDQTGDEWRFVREGEPLVFPPGHDPAKQGTLSIRETALRNEMQNRFQQKKTFPDEIKIDRHVLQGDLAKAGELRVTQATAENGWLMIAWTATAPAESTQ